MAKEWAVLFSLICSVSAYPYNINITDIKSTSAVLRWRTTEASVEEFLIQCVGSQYYAVARDGRIHNTEMHVRSQFIPEGVDTVRIGDLRPNYNYTCVIQETLPEGAPNYNGILSKPVNFTTDYAEPVRPKAPIIVKEDGVTRVNLYKSTSTKFGPISGYKVQFHVVENSFLGDIAVIDREFSNPYGKFSPITVEYAQASPKALSFQISYKGPELPSFIQIDSDLMHGALKNGFLYRVITVAYTKCKDSRIAYSPSAPSDSFIAVGVDKFVSQGRFLNNVKSLQIKIGIIAGVILPLVCLAYMCCIGMLLFCRERQMSPKGRDKKGCLSRTKDTIKKALTNSWLTCLTICFSLSPCCFLLCRRKKKTRQTSKKDYYYEKLNLIDEEDQDPDQTQPEVAVHTPSPTLVVPESVNQDTSGQRGRTLPEKRPSPTRRSPTRQSPTGHTKVRQRPEAHDQGPSHKGHTFAGQGRHTGQSRMGKSRMGKSHREGFLSSNKFSTTIHSSDDESIYSKIPSVASSYKQSHHRSHTLQPMGTSSEENAYSHSKKHVYAPTAPSYLLSTRGKLSSHPSSSHQRSDLRSYPVTVGGPSAAPGMSRVPSYYDQPSVYTQTARRDPSVYGQTTAKSAGGDASLYQQSHKSQAAKSVSRLARGDPSLSYQQSQMSRSARGDPSLYQQSHRRKSSRGDPSLYQQSHRGQSSRGDPSLYQQSRASQSVRRDPSLYQQSHIEEEPSLYPSAQEDPSLMFEQSQAAPSAQEEPSLYSRRATSSRRDQSLYGQSNLVPSTRREQSLLSVPSTRRRRSTTYKQSQVTKTIEEEPSLKIFQQSHVIPSEASLYEKSLIGESLYEKGDPSLYEQSYRGKSFGRDPSLYEQSYRSPSAQVRSTVASTQGGPSPYPSTHGGRGGLSSYASPYRPTHGDPRLYQQSTKSQSSQAAYSSSRGDPSVYSYEQSRKSPSARGRPSPSAYASSRGDPSFEQSHKSPSARGRPSPYASSHGDPSFLSYEQSARGRPSAYPSTRADSLYSFEQSHKSPSAHAGKPPLSAYSLTRGDPSFEQSHRSPSAQAAYASSRGDPSLYSFEQSHAPSPQGRSSAHPSTHGDPSLYSYQQSHKSPSARGRSSAHPSTRGDPSLHSYEQSHRSPSARGRPSPSAYASNRGDPSLYGSSMRGALSPHSARSPSHRASAVLPPDPSPSRLRSSHGVSPSPSYDRTHATGVATSPSNLISESASYISVPQTVTNVSQAQSLPESVGVSPKVSFASRPQMSRGQDVREVSPQGSSASMYRRVPGKRGITPSPSSVSRPRTVASEHRSMPSNSSSTSLTNARSPRNLASRGTDIRSPRETVKSPRSSNVSAKPHSKGVLKKTQEITSPATSYTSRRTPWDSYINIPQDSPYLSKPQPHSIRSSIRSHTTPGVSPSHSNISRRTPRPYTVSGASPSTSIMSMGSTHRAPVMPDMASRTHSHVSGPTETVRSGGRSLASTYRVPDMLDMTSRVHSRVSGLPETVRSSSRGEMISPSMSYTRNPNPVRTEDIQEYLQGRPFTSGTRTKDVSSVATTQPPQRYDSMTHSVTRTGTRTTPESKTSPGGADTTSGQAGTPPHSVKSRQIKMPVLPAPPSSHSHASSGRQSRRLPLMSHHSPSPSPSSSRQPYSRSSMPSSSHFPQMPYSSVGSRSQHGTEQSTLPGTRPSPRSSHLTTRGGSSQITSLPPSSVRSPRGSTRTSQCTSTGIPARGSTQPGSSIRTPRGSHRVSSHHSGSRNQAQTATLRSSVMPPRSHRSSMPQQSHRSSMPRRRSRRPSGTSRNVPSSSTHPASSRHPASAPAQHSIPWTTLTPAATGSSDRNRDRPLSPRFERTSGAQQLHYTTSAGPFHTADEFYNSQNDPAAGGRVTTKDSENMFLPRGYSAHSNVSMSAFQPTILSFPNRDPDEHEHGREGGYELISLSSSQVGFGSEQQSAMEVIH